MPCPQGVNIPLCFEEYNNLYMTSNPDGEKFLYAARLGGAVALGKAEYASQCVQCGECQEKCPQHLEIPALLESVVNELEGPDFKERVAMARAGVQADMSTETKEPGCTAMSAATRY